MSEAERSIAVKRKVGVTRPMSRNESPAETYSPKRRRSDGADRGKTPLPYIPSKKENKQGNKDPPKRPQLSQSDARHVLNKEDRKELISRSRRQELLRSIGIDREERESSPLTERSQRHHGLSTGKFQHRREVKEDVKSEGVKNFTITARVQPSSSSSDGDSRKRKASVSPTRSSGRLARKHSTSPEPKVPTKAPVTARLGKVVVKRSPSPERPLVRKVPVARIESSAVPSKGRERLTLSRLGKDLVNKQCEAAVQSVKSVRVRSAHSRLSDSRVVHCDNEEDRSERGRSPSVEREERPVVKVEKNVESVAGGSVSEEEDDLADMLKDSGSEPLDEGQNDEFTLDLDEEDLSQVLEREAAEEIKRLEEEELKGTKKGTRFIVTLDGVDEDKFAHEMKAEYPSPSPTALPGHLLPVGVSQQVPGSLKHYPNVPLALSHPPTLPLGAHSPIVPPIPMASVAAAVKVTPPKIQPFSISLKDSDDEHEGKSELTTGVVPPMTSYDQQDGMMVTGRQQTGLTALQKAKQNERCKFWPACAAGAECEYHHPTTHCKTFPNCRFGDKCLFIHPNCRFDSKCMRPDCPYTHSSRPSIPTAKVIAIPQSHLLIPSHVNPALSYTPYHQPASNTVCRFFPNCLNANCTFVHPKPCRFGLACTAQGCPFYHPAVPGKDKLKWQATPQTQAATAQKNTSITAVKPGEKTAV